MDLPEGVRALDAAARRLRTPFAGGEGEVQWRLWGEGPPLVLLHGGAGSWMHWARNIEGLARDHLVLAPDTPGLGSSSPPPATDDPLLFAQPLADGLESILGARPKITLVGFSFGSIVGGQLASATRVEASRLVVVGPNALGVSRPPRALVKVRSLTGAARTEAHRENLSIMMIHDPAGIDETALAIQDWNSVHARVDSRPIARKTSLREALARRGRPFAAIMGEHDHTAKPALVTPVLRTIDPGADIRVLPGVGHWCMYEGAAAFDTALRDALARLG